MSTQPNNPGQYLTECRIRRQMTQTDLAVALEVTEQAVSSWERGIVPIPKDRIVSLYRLLGFDRSKLLDLMAAQYRARLVKVVKEGMRA